MSAHRFGLSWLLVGTLAMGMGALPVILPSLPAVGQTSPSEASEFDRYMQRGYQLTAKRDYPSALVNFRRALSLRPGNRYALTAISNVEAYIARDRYAAQSSNRLTFVPSNRGMPGQRIAGATRFGECTQGSLTKIVALVPDNNLGMTAAANPSLFFFVPQSTAKSAELMLLSEAGDLLLTQQVPLNGKAGILPVTVDASKAKLQPGQKYQWIFSLTCKSNEPDANPFVTGWIERAELDSNLAQVITTMPPADRLPLLATSQLWNDTLATLVELQQSNPNDAAIKQQWQDVLKSAGIDPQIVNMPLLR
ncbi:MULTISPECIES: DUF928 domain-containing protein [unclassified Thermosynechococcus]|uniref:DUF928 domain-containing protein n=1 Tax=unclassified Thermosynechococcus TaxID=2622553 RepID=UPI002877FDD5|nr:MULTISPECIES: DUF928 domain-containing protein [unclassified Thermosynechococcus]WNC53612.1 DUF928 domain-containing protein [Thermosynechococcus sp. TG215]WNC58705.1 DUF928 domain-containing protein [Thermosynechococcus sp. TG218]